MLVTNKKKFIDYVKYAILKESSVPVIIIKAVGTSYQEKRDSNILKKLIPQIVSIETKISSEHKSWSITTITKDLHNE